MEQRHAVVSGANRGVGLALTRELARRGYQVWAGCRRPSEADELSAVDGAEALALDVADPSSIERFGDELADRTESVDLLINNAGIDSRGAGGDADKRHLMAVEPEVFAAVIEVNVTGPMLLTRRLRPLLGGGAKVVNVTSQLGSLDRAERGGGDIAYDTSKAALNMLTRRTAATLAEEGVTVVAVHPGWVQTDMGGRSARLTPEESAASILETISALGPEDSGRFLRWDGIEHPW